MTTTVAEFKTTLKLCTLVSILQEIDDRRRGKTSSGEFSNVILEGGLPLSDQQEIKIMKMSVAPSGLRATNQNPRAAPVVEEAVATQITTTLHKESNQEEVEVSS
jgi:hypothetical protein